MYPRAGMGGRYKGWERLPWKKGSRGLIPRGPLKQPQGYLKKDFSALFQDPLSKTHSGEVGRGLGLAALTQTYPVLLLPRLL